MEFTTRRLSPYFLLAIILVLGWISFRIVGVFLDYVMVGLFFAYLTYPAYEWLREKFHNRQVAALVMLLWTTAVVVVPVAFLALELVEELRQILVQLSGGNLQAVWDALQAQIAAWTGGTAEDGGNNFLATVVPSLSRYVSNQVSNLIGAMAEGIIGVFVLLYVMYYAYIDGSKFITFVHQILPMHEAHRDLLFHETGVVVKAVMYGQVLTALIQGILGAIGFWIFGVPNVAFWGVIMFIVALLPLIGPPLVWVPWGVGLLMLGRTFQGVGLLIYSAIMVSTIDNIIRPKLIGSRAQVHPVVVLLGVLGGLAVFGFSGFILGPLILSVFVTVLNVYRKELALRDESPSSD